MYSLGRGRTLAYNTQSQTEWLQILRIRWDASRYSERCKDLGALGWSFVRTFTIALRSVPCGRWNALLKQKWRGEGLIIFYRVR